MESIIGATVSLLDIQNSIPKITGMAWYTVQNTKKNCIEIPFERKIFSWAKAYSNSLLLKCNLNITLIKASSKYLYFIAFT